MVQIAPSILSADFTRLGEEIAAISAAGADIIHFDVMDGHFVPNITVGLPVVRSLRKVTKLPIDCHLMIENPGVYATQFVDAGANMVSVHVEVDHHLNRTLNAIKEHGALAGIAINPATSLVLLEDALADADFVLLMSVNPGFGGQKFIQSALERARRLRAMIEQRDLKTRIEIDGGVDRNNAAEIVAAGVDILVAGSAIFAHGDVGSAVRELRASAQPVAAL
jgi:ribulose-phosphate 3-epimerase